LGFVVPGSVCAALRAAAACGRAVFLGRLRRPQIPPAQGSRARAPRAEQHRKVRTRDDAVTVDVSGASGA
jgi:hypothetical protein